MSSRSPKKRLISRVDIPHTPSSPWQSAGTLANLGGSSLIDVSASPSTNGSLLSRIAPRLLDRIGDLDPVGASFDTPGKRLVDRLAWPEPIQMAPMVDYSTMFEVGNVDEIITPNPIDTPMGDARALEPHAEPPEMHTATPVPPSALEVAAIASAVTDDSRSTTSEALVDDLLHYTGSDVEMGYESADLAPLPASNVSLISTAASSEPNPNPHSLDPPSTSDRKISSKRPSLFRQCHNPLPDTPRNLKRIADHASAVVQDERRADSAKEAKEVAGQAVKLQVKEMPCDEGGKQQEESVLNVTTKQNRLDNSNGSGSGAKRRRPESVDTGPASRQDSQAIPVDKSEGAPMAVRYPSSSVQPMDKQFPMEHFSARGKDNKGNTTSQDANEFTGQGADKNYGPRRREWHNEDLPRSPRPRARRNRYYHLSAKGRARDDRDPSPTPPDHQTDYHKNSQDGDKDTKGHTNKPRKGDIGMQFSDRTPSSPPPPAAQAEEVQHPPDSQPLLNDHSPTNAISQQSDTVNSFPTPQNGNATLSSYACVDSPADPTSVLLPATATYRHPPLNSIPVPGLWFEKVGLDGADILEVEFDVDPETAAYWRLPDANSNDEVIPIVCLHLLCVATSRVFSTHRSVNPARPADIASALWDIGTQWPSRGKLVIEVNSEQSWGRSFLDRHLAQDGPPVDVTSYVRSGRNLVRFIQLEDLSQHTFVLHASKQENDPSGLRQAKAVEENPEAILNNYLRVVSKSKAGADPGKRHLLNLRKA